MAEMTITEARVAPTNSTQYEAMTLQAAVALAAGEAVYLNSAGKAAKALSSAIATTQGLMGITTHAASAGHPVEVLYRGCMEGLGISGLAYGALVYVSETTAGDLTDTAPSTSGDVVAVVGRVVPASANGLEKVLLVDINPAARLVAV